MSKYPESPTEMKEVAPGAFLMDGKLATQQCSLTDNETGSVSEKQDGSPSKERPDRSGLRYYKLLNLNTTSARYLVWCFVS
jgi:hypothetical protein